MCLIKRYSSKMLLAKLHNASFTQQGQHVHRITLFSPDSNHKFLYLQSSASEVMILRTARRYDIETDTIVFADGTPYTRENMRLGGLGDWVDEMFAFCKSMGVMSVDNAEYALLTAICIFSGWL